MPVNPIYKLFGQSPIRPLQTHMDKVIECAEALTPFFERVLQQDWQGASEAQQTISTLEKEADELKDNLRVHLPTGLFLPVPRTDLLLMLSLQDKIANKAKDIAGIILGRKMVFPPSIIPRYQALLSHCIATTREAHDAINKLDTLLETGFKGHEVTLVEEIIHQLHNTEHTTDNIQIQVRQDVFNIEQQYPPVDIFFLYKVIEATGELADRAEKVGGQLLVIIAR